MKVTLNEIEGLNRYLVVVKLNLGSLQKLQKTPVLQFRHELKSMGCNVVAKPKRCDLGIVLFKPVFKIFRPEIVNFESEVVKIFVVKKEKSLINES